MTDLGFASSHIRVLNTVFGYLPDREVEFLRTLPVDDLLTHVQTFAAIRRHRVHLPDEIERDFLANLTDLLAADE